MTGATPRSTPPRARCIAQSGRHSPGAWFADLTLLLFGPAVALLLPVPATVGLRLWRGAAAGPWLRTLRNATVGVMLMGVALALVSGESVLKLPGGWGGAIGLAGRQRDPRRD